MQTIVATVHYFKKIGIYDLRRPQKMKPPLGKKVQISIYIYLSVQFSIRKKSNRYFCDIND